MTFIFIFIFGLCVGSFLNCLIYRLRCRKSVWQGRSFCPQCRHQLKWLDLIPVFSFLFLKGKCRYCKQKISWQYPLVEICTAVLFSFIFLKHLGSLDFVSQFSIFNGSTSLITGWQFLILLLRDWFFAAVLIVVFVYDFKYGLILDKVVLPAAAIALAVNLYLGYAWWELLLAGLIGAGFFLFQFVVSKGKWVGGGDMRLGLLMGFLLGWPDLLFALMLAYVAGAIVGIILILLKKKKWQSRIPFAPFLASAAIVMLLYGDAIINHCLTIF